MPSKDGCVHKNEEIVIKETSFCMGFIIAPPSSGEKQWNVLFEQIVKGNVIPVIGPELVRIEDKTSRQFLIDAICQYCHIGDNQMSSFSQLTHDYRYKNSPLHRNSDIYATLASIIESNPTYFDNTEANSQLLSILQIQHFNFVITTSFDPIVENMMRKIHGDKLRVLTFCNDPAKNEDIINGEESRYPTLFYMFGKVCPKEHSYVVTDEDLLQFSQSWLRPNDSGSKAKPANLSNLFANRYMLVLGHDFQDWLFRFFWYALKSDGFGGKNSGMLALKKEDEELIGFLNRANTFSQVEPDTEALIRRLHEGIEKYESEHHINRDCIPPVEGTDVFISYSRGDSELTEAIYRRLRSHGLNVWYDRSSLEKGKDFMRQIEYAIRNSTFFVPLFTPTITKQVKEEHPYRKEWLYAVEHIQNIGGISYCFPFFQQGFNMDDPRCDIPHDLKRHDAFSFTPNSLEQDIDRLANYLVKELRKRRNGQA